jgi:hypothetical protein
LVEATLLGRSDSPRAQVLSRWPPSPSTLAQEEQVHQAAELSIRGPCVGNDRPGGFVLVSKASSPGEPAVMMGLVEALWSTIAIEGEEFRLLV